MRRRERKPNVLEGAPGVDALMRAAGFHHQYHADVPEGATARVELAIRPEIGDAPIYAYVDDDVEFEPLAIGVSVIEFRDGDDTWAYCPVCHDQAHVNNGGAQRVYDCCEPLGVDAFADVDAAIDRMQRRQRITEHILARITPIVDHEVNEGLSVTDVYDEMQRSDAFRLTEQFVADGQRVDNCATHACQRLRRRDV